MKSAGERIAIPKIIQLNPCLGFPLYQGGNLPIITGHVDYVNIDGSMDMLIERL